MIELALVALLDLADRSAPGRDRLQDSLGVRQQRLAGRRQAHAALGALEDARAELSLQRRDARGEGRLAQVQGARGGAHGAEARDLQEGLQAWDVHLLLLLLPRGRVQSVGERNDRSQGSHDSIGHALSAGLRSVAKHPNGPSPAPRPRRRRRMTATTADTAPGRPGLVRQDTSADEGRLIDPRGQRFGAALSVAFLAVGFAAGLPFVVALLALALGISALFGTRYSVLGRPWPYVRRAPAHRAAARARARVPAPFRTGARGAGSRRGHACSSWSASRRPGGSWPRRWVDCRPCWPRRATASAAGCTSSSGGFPRSSRSWPAGRPSRSPSASGRRCRAVGAGRRCRARRCRAVGAGHPALSPRVDYGHIRVGLGHGGDSATWSARGISRRP